MQSPNGGQAELHPIKYLEPNSQNTKALSAEKNVALIILNSPIEDVNYFHRLYEHASFRLCADGGANRLYNAVTTLSNDDAKSNSEMSPDMIHGDLDSLHDGVRAHYEQLGVKISYDPDQYSTDFGKAIKKVVELMPEVHEILIHGSLGGRVDQGIGLLHELYREQKIRHPGIRFWLFTEASVSVILQPGVTTLHTPLNQGLIKRNMGLLPIYGPARVSMSGVEWPVEDWLSNMGGEVSTSQHITADSISIKTDMDVLFTVERAGR